MFIERDGVRPLIVLYGNVFTWWLEMEGGLVVLVNGGIPNR